MNEAGRSTLKLWRKPSLIWLALMLLLALTVGSAYIPLGIGNGLVNYGVAVTKAALVVFMHLDRSRALIRLAALAGLFWLVFLFSLSFGDYLTRDWSGSATTLAPGKKELATQERGNFPKERLPLVPRFGSRD
jgi:cytochrome c oxidase subunit 4